MAELDLLKSLITPASAEDLRRTRAKIETHLDLIEEAALDHVVQVDLARHIATALVALVDAADSFDAEGRALVRGAIEYFVISRDEDDDLESEHGMEDDARVCNAVCEHLGRTDLLVEIK